MQINIILQLCIPAINTGMITEISKIQLDLNNWIVIKLLKSQKTKDTVNKQYNKHKNLLEK